MENSLNIGKNRNLDRSICFISVLTHAIALLLFRLNFADLQVGYRLTWHFYTLILISLAASIGLYYGQDDRQIIVLLLSKFIVFFLTGYPLGSDISIETVLFTGLIFETIFYPSDRTGIILLTLFNIGFIFSQGGGSAWGQSLAPVPLHNMITVIFINLVIMFFSFRLKIKIRENRIQHEKIEHLNSAITQLTDANIGFQSYVKDQEFNILLEERKRVSREIHDTVGYALTNIIMLTEEARILENNPGKRNNTLVNAREQARNALQETRAALRELRNEKLPKNYGINMIEKLVSAFRQASRMEITVDYGNLPRFMNNDMDRIIFRLIQEGLTNAFRHGMATKITISFWLAGADLRVSILDNGVGATEIVEGIGMAGMRERMDKAGGSLVLKNVEDGFKIEAVIPYHIKGTDSDE